MEIRWWNKAIVYMAYKETIYGHKLWQKLIHKNKERQRISQKYRIWKVNNFFLFLGSMITDVPFKIFFETVLCEFRQYYLYWTLSCIKFDYFVKITVSVPAT